MNRVTPQMLDPVEVEPIESTAVPSLERRRLRTYMLMLLADAALFNLSFALAALLWEGFFAEPRAMIAAQALLPV